MQMNPANPVIVQGDGKVLLETDHASFEQARDFLGRFAELEASPDRLHTYKISSLSLWNAASAGMGQDEIVEGLRALSKFDIPANVLEKIEDTIGRYGLVKLERHPTREGELLRVTFASTYIEKLVKRTETGREMLQADGRRDTAMDAGLRGLFKQRMLLENWPVEDDAGFLPGDPLSLTLREHMKGNGKPFGLRPYQKQAVSRWYMDGAPAGGHGVVVLPCGAGKTVVALEAMVRAQTHTLVVCNNQSAVTQWVREILDKTSLREDQVGEYTGQNKVIRPVTVATYQVLTWRRSKKHDYEHFGIFRDHNWGLLIYDEVHLLPAPVCGATAELQGCRRLGLTATLVREDGREGDVFSLVGPKRFDLPWQYLEKRGFVAEARCYEVRVPFGRKARAQYEDADEMSKFRMASENPAKLDVVADLIDRHSEDNLLIIGTYLGQLKEVAKMTGAPLITGKTPQKMRDELFGKFRSGRIKLLVVSKVANFAIDLPDANVAVQISGSFGSRQEEAQRLGRILRPKERDAFFYTVVTTDTKEQDFAVKRQLFLTEQGYRYHIEDRAAK
ncbi:MAG: DNA repair helicase XPB [Myxococcota bacterium]